MRRPPGSWTGLASLGNTVGMLGRVFDHQAPLTRPLEAVVAACSTTRRRWVQGDEHSPWVAEMSPSHGFSRISEKSRFSSKIKVVKSARIYSRLSRACVRAGKRLPDTLGMSHSRLTPRSALGRHSYTRNYAGRRLIRLQQPPGTHGSPRTKNALGFYILKKTKLYKRALCFGCLGAHTGRIFLFPF